MTTSMPCFVALALVGAPLAMAQTADRREAALQACLAIESDRQRLACLEAELHAAGESEQAPSREAAPVSAPAPAPAQEAPPRLEPNRAAEPIERASPPSEDPAGQRRQTVTIVDVRRNVLGDTYFETADGRVLLQRSVNRGRYPDPPFQAELDGAALDTYFLSSPLGGPRVRVSIAE
jgi:hypothetical protein